jgi:hypothetical protein
MGLAMWMIVTVTAGFAALAGLGLAWSLTTGQWRNAPGAAAAVLDCDAPLGGEGDDDA